MINNYYNTGFFDNDQCKFLFLQSNIRNAKSTSRELPRFSSATTIGSLSTNASFQTCTGYGDDSYDGDMSNVDTKEEVESNDILQNVNVLSDIDSITDVLSSMGIQSPKQVMNVNTFTEKIRSMC